jgi:hypothetical protein
LIADRSAGLHTEQLWADYIKAIDCRFDGFVVGGHRLTLAYPIEARRARTG